MNPMTSTTLSVSAYLLLASMTIGLVSYLQFSVHFSICVWVLLAHCNAQQKLCLPHTLTISQNISTQTHETYCNNDTKWSNKQMSLCTVLTHSPPPTNPFPSTSMQMMASSLPTILWSSKQHTDADRSITAYHANYHLTFKDGARLTTEIVDHLLSKFPAISKL